MNDGQACCSCLTVKYDPEEVETYVEEFGKSMPALRERWTCTACGSHFVRKAVAERLREIEEWAHRAGALDGNRRLKEALQTNDCEHRWSDPSKDASPVACTKCGDPKVREMTKGNAESLPTVCPDCHGDLRLTSNGRECPHCGLVALV